MSHAFHPTIIREYDMRGVVGRTLFVDDAEALGRAFGTMVVRAGGKKTMVGYDGRTHSPDMEIALIKGLASTGLEVVRIGLGPTPMLYFSVQHADACAGIMVTGSHNPPDQNGFKMLLSKRLKDGGPVYGARIKQLAEMALANDVVKGAGVVQSLDVRESYVERLLQDFKRGKSLNAVWDCGNGAGGEIVRRLVEKLPGEHTLLFPEIDGRFPNHHPDPTEPENLRDLQKAVKERKADVGIAFDGDADRIGAVDRFGRIVAGDQLLAIYATEVLKEIPGAAIIADVKASQALFDKVAACGGSPIMWKTGHSLVKVKMVETKSPLAGEMSGHIFFADKYYGYDDAIYAAVRLLSILGAENASLDKLRDDLPQTVCTPELRFPVDEARKFAVVEEVKGRLLAKGAKVCDIDGVRVTMPEGWWLLRASNTQAVLVARAESSSEEGLKKLKKCLADELSASGLSLPR